MGELPQLNGVIGALEKGRHALTTFTPADVERNSSEAEPREVEVDRFQPQWDGDDPGSSETSTH